jgi:molybdopterin/thiamine biosynthesis adenylyltransferase
MPNASKTVDRFSVRLIEDHHLQTWPMPSASIADRLLLARQPLTVTPLLRALLARTVVAVVGLSGGGSQVIAHLAALGFGEIIGIDDQRADDSNRLATPHLGWLDALLRIPKVAAAKFRVWLINRHVTFTGVQARVPEKHALEALKRADIIIGCVNNLHARADLNDLAWRYCIPYIDIGLRMITDESVQDPSPLTAFPGNLFAAIPGGACLWCTNFLTEAKLQLETGGRGRSYLQDAAGRDALVSCFNGTLAAEAAAEALRLITGLDSHRERRRQYDGFTGSLLEMSIARKQTCSLCNSILAAGDPVWQPIRPEH